MYPIYIACKRPYSLRNACVKRSFLVGNRLTFPFREFQIILFGPRRLVSYFSYSICQQSKSASDSTSNQRVFSLGLTPVWSCWILYQIKSQTIYMIYIIVVGRTRIAKINRRDSLLKYLK